MSAAKQPVPQGPAPIGHNQALAVFETVPLAEIIVWEPAAEQAADVTEETLQAEVDLMLMGGQRERPKGRRRSDGRIEIVNAGHTLEVATRFNNANPGNQRSLQVAVYSNLPDRIAYGMLAQQIEPAHVASSFARGQLFERAISEFGSAEKAAIACGVAKSTISKHLAVIECNKLVGAHILIHRDISQRDAAWLVGIIGRKPDGSDSKVPEMRAALRQAIGVLPARPEPAKKVFAALKAAVKPLKPNGKASQNRRALTIGDAAIGSIKFSRGAARVDLMDISNLTPNEIAKAISHAIAAHRASTTY